MSIKQELPNYFVPVVAERVRPRLIADIIVNDEIRDLFPESHQFLFDSDFLVNNTFLTLPQQTQTTKRTGTFPTIETFGRAITYRNETIKYGRKYIGNFIYSKGTNVSGHRYLDLLKNEGQYTGNDPQGFFGSSDAIREQNISNKLLENGNRVHPVLGTVVFDPDKLQKYLRTVWNKFTDNNQSQNSLINPGERVAMELEKIKNYGDIPAQVHRVGATENRFYFTSEYDIPRAIRQSAMTWLHEMSIWDDSDNNLAYLDFVYSRSDLQTGLEKLSQGIHINNGIEYLQLRLFLYGLITEELFKLKSSNIPSQNYFSLKDTDFSFTPTDWEGSFDITSNHSSNITTSLVSAYTYFLFRCGACNESFTKNDILKELTSFGIL